MRFAIPARRSAATLAALLALTAGVAGATQSAEAARGPKPPKGGTTSPTSPTPTPTTTTVDIADVSSTTCPKVMEYTSCAAMNVTVTNAGATGYMANASPANNAVTYNSYYQGTSATWSAVVAHEAGGHVDAWNEIVAKVGATKAWTDYYDLDYFGELWAEGRYKALKGTARDFTRSEGKETYLDCVGPVAHGYTGNYLSMWGFSGLSAQQSFCASGVAQVMSDALTKARPS